MPPKTKSARERGVTVSDIDTIVCETTIAAAPETVFDFFTRSEQYVRWMGTTARLDAQPGGAYVVDINEQLRARGTFVEILPYSRIVFTFGWEGVDQSVPTGSSTVEVTLTPTADGTHVRLLHRGLRLLQDRDQHREGWQLYLSRLEAVAAGGKVGRDPNANSPSEG
jgi:uncharacterized protein YndB with AHSA1/START domain